MQLLTLFRYGKYILLVLSALFIFSACMQKVKLVGEYDEIMDNAVHTIESTTTSHITKILTYKGQAEGSYKKTKGFYPDIKGEVQSLIVRAEVIEKDLKKKPLTDNFKALKQQYDDLELLHQTPFNKKVITKAQEALDRSFRAIVKYIIYLKWNQAKPETKE